MSLLRTPSAFWQSALKKSLNQIPDCGSNFSAIGSEYELQQTAAEIRPVNPLARRGKKHRHVYRVYTGFP